MIRVLRPALIVLLVALFATPQAAMAQETPVNESVGPAVLVADKVWLEGNTRLIASGNVEALYDDVRIKRRGSPMTAVPINSASKARSPSRKATMYWFWQTPPRWTGLA